MAKVGRASRNSSYLRVEEVSASKTIGAAESGELYLIQGGSITSAIAITLPTAKAGAYFKFLWAGSMAGASASVAITSANGSNTMRGVVQSILKGSADTDTTFATDFADESDDTKVTVDDDVEAGSYIEVVSDGTNWYATGVVVGNGIGRVAFG
jgi:hypothetical protein